MSSELKSEIEFEIEELRKLLSMFSNLRQKVSQSIPNDTEIVALAAFLHSFYSGMENIFKRILINMKETLSHGESWHIDLLERMTQSDERRSAVISMQLYKTLLKYLGFRHMFRHAYTFHLNWERMEPLVRECEDTFHAFENELTLFVEEIKGKE